MSRGYIPRGNPRRGRKGGDARIRFNKCHRPQVGDVLAPQSRLRGVRFPRDSDSSLLSFALSSRVFLTRASVGRASVSFDIRAPYAKRTPRACVHSFRDSFGYTMKFQSNRMESDHRDTLRCVTLQRWLTALASNTATKISYSETSTRGRAHGTNVG